MYTFIKSEGWVSNMTAGNHNLCYDANKIGAQNRPKTGGAY